MSGRRAHHGLVLGKFYPPHAGHHYLIDVAAAACDRVSVLVAASSVETGLDLHARMRLLEAVHASAGNVRVYGVTDEVAVDYEDPAIWGAHLEAWRPALAEAVAEHGALDAVFSSEGYGVELARRLDIRPVCVDQARSVFAVSASQVRSDPLGHWDDLSAPTQAALARHVVVLGAESTGTTTVSRALASALRRRGGPLGATTWVPEHGRRHTWVKLGAARADAALVGRPGPEMGDLTWGDADLVACAGGQQADIATAAGRGGPVVVADTDAFATTVWARRYLGHVPAAVAEAAGRGRADLYLLTDHVGVPFVQDGIRDGEHVRAAMTGWFADACAASGVPTVWLRGSLERRVADALDAVDDLLAGTWGFGTPLEYAGSPTGEGVAARV